MTDLTVQLAPPQALGSKALGSKALGSKIPGSFAAGWHAAGLDIPEDRPSLTIDLDVDVCVVGAGLAGLTAAREIARHGWSVVVLEAGRVGGAASGRNTGFVLPGFGEDLGTIVERVGEDHARALWALSENGVDYVRRTAAELPGVEAAPGWAYVTKTDRSVELAALAHRLRSFGTDAEYWAADRVRAVLPTSHYFGAISFPSAFSINPLRYVLGLARLAEQAGVRIFERTPAVSIDPAGVRKRINTPSARVRAAHVVLSGNVDLGTLMPRLAATLVPITSYVMVTAPLGPVLRETIRYRGAVSDGDRSDNHYRIVGDDRLMWAGRMTVRERNPQRYMRGLLRDVRRLFPQFGAVEAEDMWSGTLGMPIHRMPQIGELYRGVWVGSGFGGHGLNTTAMAGELIARGITEGDQTWRLFAPYELVWAGGGFGRAVTRAAYLLRRPAEQAAQAFARYTERAKAKRAKKRAERAALLAQRKTEQEAAGRVAAYKAAAEKAIEAPSPATPPVPPQSPVPAPAAKADLPASNAPVAEPPAAASPAPAASPAKKRKRGKKAAKKGSAAKKP